MWRHIETRLENAVHAVVLAVADIETGYTIVRGPELLPSEYLAHFRAHGWVCLTSILTPAIVDALQRIACTDGHAQRTPDRSRRQICQGGALAKTALEPVSVWLARRYMQTDDIRLAHSPGIGVMTPDDGKRTVSGENRAAILMDITPRVHRALFSPRPWTTGRWSRAKPSGDGPDGDA